MAEELSSHPNKGERAYISWRHHVDRVLKMQTGGMTVDQFEGLDFYAAYRDQLTPKQVVDVILDGAGWAR